MYFNKLTLNYSKCFFIIITSEFSSTENNLNNKRVIA